MDRTHDTGTKPRDAGKKQHDTGKKQRDAGTKRHDAGEMGLTDHLGELRRRIVVCLIALILAMAAGLPLVRQIVRALLELGERCHYAFVYLAPQELVLQYFSVDLLFAVCAALPVALYELWAFLRPGLTKTEKLLYLLSMGMGLLFAGLGILFAYKILIPFMLYFLITMSEGSGVSPAVSVQNYLSFLLTIFLVFAAIFELPVAAVLLTQFQIVKIAWLKKIRKAAIVAVFLVAAVITPPDVVSQIMVALPLLGLYELSVVLCIVAAKIRKPGGTEEGEKADSGGEGSPA